MVVYKNHLPEKNAPNRVILSQIARLQHNRVNTQRLQKKYCVSNDFSSVLRNLSVAKITT